MQEDISNENPAQTFNQQTTSIRSAIQIIY